MLRSIVRLTLKDWVLERTQMLSAAVRSSLEHPSLQVLELDDCEIDTNLLALAAHSVSMLKLYDVTLIATNGLNEAGISTSRLKYVSIQYFHKRIAPLLASTLLPYSGRLEILQMDLAARQGNHFDVLLVEASSTLQTLSLLHDPWNPNTNSPSLPRSESLRLINLSVLDEEHLGHILSLIPTPSEIPRVEVISVTLWHADDISVPTSPPAIAWDADACLRQCNVNLVWKGHAAGVTSAGSSSALGRCIQTMFRPFKPRINLSLTDTLLAPGEVNTY
ncbi:hypothetical protein FB45DRAFT_1001645 [Roridomyces roridus]|uniref:RNI-like protein n=1 Tax=Roridomyces roridus TaxID=1738132 RepID=A0AAD7FTG9_9AGAR|nr:hypothetical protein FB45DRAFT_1001645 [Roridomyces roridus]